MKKKHDFDIFTEGVEYEGDFEKLKSKLPEKAPESPRRKVTKVLSLVLAGVLVLAAILPAVFLPLWRSETAGNGGTQTDSASADGSQRSFRQESVYLVSDDPAEMSGFEDRIRTKFSDKAKEVLNDPTADRENDEVEIFARVLNQHQYEPIKSVLKQAMEDPSYYDEALELSGTFTQFSFDELSVYGIEAKEIGYSAYILKGSREALHNIYYGKYDYNICLPEELSVAEVDKESLYGTYTATYTHDTIEITGSVIGEREKSEPFEYTLKGEYNIERIEGDELPAEILFDIAYTESEFFVNNVKAFVMLNYETYRVTSAGGEVVAYLYRNPAGIYASLLDGTHRIYKLEKN